MSEVEHARRPELGVSVRRVVEADIESVVEMVHELAAYEEAADQCHLTAAALRTALFGPAPALFGHVAEAGEEVVGFALWFRTFSTWDGVHGIYLEDLFVRTAHRGAGSAARCLRSSPPSASATATPGCSGGRWTGTPLPLGSTARSARSRWTSGLSCG